MRRVLLVAMLAGFLGAVIGTVAVPLALWAQGEKFCWGSICQASGGEIQFAGNVRPSQPIVISTSGKFTTGLAGDLILDCQRERSVAPGAGTVALRARGGKVYLVVGNSPDELLLPVVRRGILDTAVGFGC